MFESISAGRIAPVELIARKAHWDRFRRC